MSEFDSAVAFTLSWEGGFRDVPWDRGGPTNMGITGNLYRRVSGDPSADVKLLTRDGAIAIYKSEFWDACKCDSLDRRLAWCLFDMAVNSGQGNAIQVLRLSTWAPASVEAQAFAYLSLRRRFVIGGAVAKQDLQGVLNRIDALRKAIGL